MLAELPPRVGRIRLPAEFYGHYVWTLCSGCGVKTRSYCRLCGLGVCKSGQCKLVHQLAQRTTMKASTCVSEDT